MQDRPGPRSVSFLFAVPLLGMLGACTPTGDLGRPAPTLISKTFTSGVGVARELIDAEDYDMPLTGAEDALRLRARDLVSIRDMGVISQVGPSRNGDGYARVSALIADLKVERQRFASFTKAGDAVMQIDEARRERLAGLDALTARRQSLLVVARRGQNNRLIRNGVRTMRARSLKYKRMLKRLPVEIPHVRLDELLIVHEELHEDVVRFHAKIDQQAHMQLGRSASTAPLKP